MLRIALFTALLLPYFAHAAKIDTVDTYSSSMKKTIKAVIVTPDSYAQARETPVVYLLHGYSGNHTDWAKRTPDLGKVADLYQSIIVCPDGGYDSWYLDSPVNSAYRYETYVASELVSWVDEHYKTVKNRKGRAITGLSMGGHGALYLAFRHQDVYGAAGSMSGGVDIRPFPLNWGISKLLGTYASSPDNWEKHSVVNLVHLLTPNSLALMIDCGVNDFFYTVNKQLHQKLEDRNIPHDYTARPGEHNWNYWKKSIHYQMLFMKRYFDQGAGK